MTAWQGRPTPAEEMLRWHAAARERDEAALAAGPDDDTESSDPHHPWRQPEDDAAAVDRGGRTGRSFAEAYGGDGPIPPDEIAEWLLDAEDYIPKLREAGQEPLARFLVAAYLIIRQQQSTGRKDPT